MDRWPTWILSGSRSTGWYCARTSFVDDYQLWEAGAHGADLALRMVVSLKRLRTGRHEGIKELGLTPLVESHRVDEIGRAWRQAPTGFARPPLPTSTPL